MVYTWIKLQSTNVHNQKMNMWCCIMRFGRREQFRHVYSTECGMVGMPRTIKWFVTGIHFTFFFLCKKTISKFQSLACNFNVLMRFLVIKREWGLKLLKYKSTPHLPEIWQIQYIIFSKRWAADLISYVYIQLYNTLVNMWNEILGLALTKWHELKYYMAVQ